MMAQLFFAGLTLTVPESPYLGNAKSDDFVRAVPALDADGFKVGAKWLKADSGENILVYTDCGKARFRVTARVRPEVRYYSPVVKQRGQVEGNCFRRESPVEVLKSTTGPRETLVGKYISILEKTPEGKCRMTFDAVCDGAERLVNSTSFLVSREFLDECIVEAEAEGRSNAGTWTKPTRMTFVGSDGTLAFALEFDTNTVSAASLSRNTGRLGVSHRGTRFSVTFDPGETYVPKKVPFLAGGVDFRTESGVNVAEYQASKNILINPSFESGAHYWRTQVASDVRNIITNGVARSGRRCLYLDTTVQSVGTVLKSDTDYTFSAWIRPANGKGGGQLRVHPRGVRRTASFLKRLVLNKRNRDGAWERVSGTFHTYADFHECVIWLDGEGLLVDDVQIEEGAAATEYAGNPFGIELLTDQASEVYADAKKPQNLRLHVSGPEGAAGELSVKAHDVFDRRLLDRVFDLKIPVGGNETIALGPDSNWPLGTFVFSVRLKSGDVDYIDYLRFSKIDARDGRDRLRGLQGTFAFGRFKPDVTRPAYHYERLRDFGIGTLSYSGNANSEKYDRKRFACTDEWTRQSWTFDWKETALTFSIGGGLIDDIQLSPAGQETPEVVNPFGLELKTIPGVGFEIPSAGAERGVGSVEIPLRERGMFPWIDVWVSPNEVSGHWTTVKKGKLEDYARALMAMQNGVRRANPKATFLAYSTCNLSELGRREIYECFAAAQRLVPGFKFDAVDVHPYRPFPDNPDLDEDLNVFNQMLARLGYDTSFEIWGSRAATTSRSSWTSGTTSARGRAPRRRTASARSGCRAIRSAGASGSRPLCICATSSSSTSTRRRPRAARPGASTYSTPST